MGLSGDTVQVIEQAVEEYTKQILSGEGDPALETSVDRITVYEVRGLRYSPPRLVSNISQPKKSFKEAHKGAHEQIPNLVLDDSKLARRGGLVTLLATKDPLKRISSANLIVECGECDFAVGCRRC